MKCRWPALSAGLVAVAMGVVSCGGRRADTTPPIALAHVDLDRMYGRWYLVATVRHKGFEQGMIGPYDEYSKRPDGDIRDDFYVRRETFGAPQKHYTLHSWVRPGTNNGHWRTQLFWPINVPFLALYTDPDYRYVLFGEQNRQMGWMYSRSQTVPEADYQQLLDRFQALGYDRSQFVRFVQLPEQIGQAGFWSDDIH